MIGTPASRGKDKRMKYSEKKECDLFFTRIIEKIERNVHCTSEVMRLLHNSKIEFRGFLDNDLGYQDVKTFILEPKKEV
jgi:hypothetical protein